MSAILDVCLACLPYIWYESVGGDAIPRAYMLKAATYVSMYFAILIIHSFTIRPQYPLIIAWGNSFVIYYFSMLNKIPGQFSTDFVNSYAR